MINISDHDKNLIIQRFFSDSFCKDLPILLHYSNELPAGTKLAELDEDFVRASPSYKEALMILRNMNNEDMRLLRASIRAIKILNVNESKRVPPKYNTNNHNNILAKLKSIKSKSKEKALLLNKEIFSKEDIPIIKQFLGYDSTYSLENYYYDLNRYYDYIENVSMFNFLDKIKKYTVEAFLKENDFLLL